MARQNQRVMRLRHAFHDSGNSSVAPQSSTLILREKWHIPNWTERQFDAGTRQPDALAAAPNRGYTTM